MRIHSKYLLFFGFIFLCTSEAMPTPSDTLKIESNEADGTEYQGQWHPDGFFIFDGGPRYLNYLGRDGLSDCQACLTFKTASLQPSEKVAFARVVFSASGSEVSSSVKLSIEGIIKHPYYSAGDLPSKQPKTKSRIPWEINEDWFYTERLDSFIPYYYHSPDISPLINEIIASCPADIDLQDISLVISDESEPGSTNYVRFFDWKTFSVKSKTPAKLEIYKTVYDTFIGKELLGRPTDRSVTVNLFSIMESETFVEYGPLPDVYPYKTRTEIHPAETPIEIVMDNLEPNREYYYRLAYRKPNQGPFEKGATHSFHTQRTAGSTYSFAIQADEHIMGAYILPEKKSKQNLYRIALNNIASVAENDFFISLGDFAHPELYVSRNAADFNEARDRYLIQRSYIDSIAHSIPFYLVIGNHEGEEGWNYNPEHGLSNNNNLSVIATRARKEIIPNPSPDHFYTGNTDHIPEYGLREDYYAWEWGDALFVVLDPFWYTKNKPHDKGFSDGNDNGWEWTLGKLQYDWLFETLHHSDARWKIVFIHHLTSTRTEKTGLNYSRYYGYGGIEVAKYSVDQNPSFEWGGEDENGNDIFSEMRPGWEHGAIHDLLVEEGVDVVFKGHDHFFARQELDGIVYQTCPQPTSKYYGLGWKEEGNYKYGDLLPNSGHLQVTVDPKFLKVDYVRAFLPNHGENGEIAHSYIINNKTALTPQRKMRLNAPSRPK